MRASFFERWRVGGRELRPDNTIRRRCRCAVPSRTARGPAAHAYLYFYTDIAPMPSSVFEVRPTMIERSWFVSPPTSVIDVHQHLWPPALIESLRSLGSSSPVRLDGWTLHLPGEPPYEVEPTHHDLALRVAQ